MKIHWQSFPPSSWVTRCPLFEHRSRNSITGWWKTRRSPTPGAGLSFIILLNWIRSCSQGPLLELNMLLLNKHSRYFIKEDNMNKGQAWQGGRSQPSPETWGPVLKAASSKTHRAWGLFHISKKRNSPRSPSSFCTERHPIPEGGCRKIQVNQ